MTIERKIKLNKNLYYVIINLKYKKNKDGITTLKLKKDNYFDCGDLSILIEKIEKNYNNSKIYDKNISIMNDIIYIYENLPFLSGIKEVSISSKDNLPSTITYIEKEEIDKYIEENNIKITINNNFKLYDEHTWKI